MNQGYNKKSASAHEITVEGTMPKRRKLGDSVELTLRLINNGHSVISVGESGEFWELHVRVHNAEGQPAVVTRQGRASLGTDNPMRMRFILLYFAPHESRDWKIDLQECFELPQGKYKASANLEINPNTKKMFRLKIEDLAFEIIR